MCCMSKLHLKLTVHYCRYCVKEAVMQNEEPCPSCDVEAI